MKLYKKKFLRFVSYSYINLAILLLFFFFIYCDNILVENSQIYNFETIIPKTIDRGVIPKKKKNKIKIIN